MTTGLRFPGALHADGPAPEHAAALGLYGWLVGDWEMDAVIHRDDGSRFEGRGEIHAGWVLAGRAIQDVWILPGVFHGTTLRIFDPGRAARHISWSDPVRQVYTRQTGRAAAGGIVQEGTDDAGVPVRWSFSDITPDTFRWTGERAPDGAGWRVQTIFHARRTGGRLIGSHPTGAAA